MVTTTTMTTTAHCRRPVCPDTKGDPSTTCRTHPTPHWILLFERAYDGELSLRWLVVRPSASLAPAPPLPQ